jgi:hypothetical protein
VFLPELGERAPPILLEAVFKFFIGVRRTYFAVLNDTDSDHRLKKAQRSAGWIAQFKQSVFTAQIGPGLGINDESCHRQTSQE